jgi:hypothetical protein
VTSTQQFVERDSIPSIYFERSYFLTPGGNSDKAYHLLAEIVERSGKAGIATFVAGQGIRRGNLRREGPSGRAGLRMSCVRLRILGCRRRSAEGVGAEVRASNQQDGSMMIS